MMETACKQRRCHRMRVFTYLFICSVPNIPLAQKPSGPRMNVISNQVQGKHLKSMMGYKRVLTFLRGHAFHLNLNLLQIQTEGKWHSNE